MQTNFKLGNSGLPQNTVISALRRRPCDLDKTQSISNMSCWTKNRKLRLFLIDLFYSSPSRHNQSSTLLNKKTNRGDHIKTLTSPVVTRMKARSEREDGWWLWLLKNNISNFSRFQLFSLWHIREAGTLERFYKVINREPTPCKDCSFPLLCTPPSVIRWDSPVQPPTRGVWRQLSWYVE